MARPKGSRNRKPRFIEGDLNREIENIDHQIEQTQQKLSELTQDEIQKVPVKEVEPQTLLSKKELEMNDAPVIKPLKSIATPGKPIPRQAEERKRGWEYVKVVAEHREMAGASVEFWKNPYGGDPCSFWEIPTNIPVYVPRWVADHLSKLNYMRLTMQERPVGELQAEAASNHLGFSQPSGVIVVQERIPRITCRPAGFSF